MKLSRSFIFKMTLATVVLPVLGVSLVWMFRPGVSPERPSNASRDMVALSIASDGLWRNAAGAWRTSARRTFDPLLRRETTRLYKVWDPRPSRELEISWSPDQPDPSAAPRLASGSGMLVWRRADRAAPDRRLIAAEYVGGVRDGMLEGFGTYASNDDGVVYSGAWLRGKPHGQGRLNFPNGDQYEGMFVDGRPNGRGSYREASGEVFEGLFVAGLREGRGQTVLPNGFKYVSQWIRGRETAVSAANRQTLANTAPAATCIRVENVAVELKSGGCVTYSLDAQGYVPHTSNNPRQFMAAWQGVSELRADDSSFSLSSKCVEPVRITFDVRNCGTEDVEIKTVRLVDRSSTHISWPAIQLVAYAPYGKPGFTLRNFGDAASNARLAYTFAPPVQRKQHQQSNSSFAQKWNVDLSQAIRDEGVQPGTTTSVTGSLSYLNVNRPFRATVTVPELFAGGPFELGRLADDSAQQFAQLAFQSPPVDPPDGSGNLTVRHWNGEPTVSPKTPRLIWFQFAPRKSSRHNFNIEVESVTHASAKSNAPITISYFAPTWYAN